MTLIATPSNPLVSAGKTFVVLSADQNKVLSTTVLLTPAEARQLAIDLVSAAEQLDKRRLVIDGKQTDWTPEYTQHAEPL